MKTSKYRGVHVKNVWGRKKFTAQATVKGVAHYLGTYDDEKQAARSFDLFVIKMNLNRETNFLKKKQ